MNIDISTALEASAAGITALSGLWAGWRKIRYGIQAKKDKERQELLEQANKEIDRVKEELEQKISSLRQEFESHKVSLDKDLDYMRASYNAEIKVLGEKIESLREDLGQRHSEMVTLLTRLVSKS